MLVRTGRKGQMRLVVERDVIGIVTVPAVRLGVSTCSIIRLFRVVLLLS